MRDVFTVDEFLAQMEAVAKMGPDPVCWLIRRLLGRKEALRHEAAQDAELEQQVLVWRAVRDVMTAAERAGSERFPRVRRRELAEAAGLSEATVDGFVKQYRTARDMLEKMSRRR